MIEAFLASRAGKRLVEFLRGFIPAFFKAVLAALRSRRSDANAGAEDQRKADDKAKSEAVKRAEKTADDLRKASDDDLDRRIDGSL